MLKLDIIEFDTKNEELLKKAFEVRREVFIVEQKVKEYEEFDEYEDESVHFVALLDNKAVGTSRLRQTKDGIKLERFAVLKELRNKGIGQSILEKTINRAKKYGQNIYLHAQVSAVNFYAKNGFVKSGDKFSECDIMHYTMNFNH